MVSTLGRGILNKAVRFLTLIFGDSFDLYNVVGDMADIWNFRNGSLTSGGRYGGKFIDINNNSTGFQRNLGAEYTSLIFMADFRRSANSGATVTIFKATESNTTHIDLRHVGATGQFQVTRNGTVLGTSTFTLDNDVWAHIQLKFTIDSSAGIVTLRINGDQDIITLTGQNTMNGGTGIVNQINLLCTGSGNVGEWDNVALCSTTGDAPNDLLSQEPRFYILSPVSEGFQQDLTPSTGTDNSLTVDEVPNNGDTDYNSSSTLNALDLFNIADLPVSTATIFAVQSRVYARREDSGTRGISPIFRINSTNYVLTETNISNTYTWVNDIAAKNPDTNAAWTVSDINGLQAGYKITT